MYRPSRRHFLFKTGIGVATLTMGAVSPGRFFSPAHAANPSGRSVGANTAVTNVFRLGGGAQVLQSIAGAAATLTLQMPNNGASAGVVDVSNGDGLSNTDVYISLLQQTLRLSAMGSTVTLPAVDLSGSAWTLGILVRIQDGAPGPKPLRLLTVANAAGPPLWLGYEGPSFANPGCIRLLMPKFVGQSSEVIAARQGANSEYSAFAKTGRWVWIFLRRNAIAGTEQILAVNNGQEISAQVHAGSLSILWAPLVAMPPDNRLATVYGMSGPAMASGTYAAIGGDVIVGPDAAGSGGFDIAKMFFTNNAMDPRQLGIMAAGQYFSSAGVSVDGAKDVYFNLNTNVAAHLQDIVRKTRALAANFAEGNSLAGLTPPAELSWMNCYVGQTGTASICFSYDSERAVVVVAQQPDGPVETIRNIPAPAAISARRELSKDDFGIHYIRWPYDPSVNPAKPGFFYSNNPSRWHTEYDGRIGWVRAFDPNIHGRIFEGIFTSAGLTANIGSRPNSQYGKKTGQKFYTGMLRPDGSYDFSKLQLLLGSARAKGVRVLLNLSLNSMTYVEAKDGQAGMFVEQGLSTGEFLSANSTAYYVRIKNFLGALLDVASVYGDTLGALEVANEAGPDYFAATNIPISYFDSQDYFASNASTYSTGFINNLAVLCRFAKDLVAEKGLAILVCSPPFQGGEASLAAAFLNASAQHPVTVGNRGDGAGKTGKDYIDVLAHHNYGSFSRRGGPGAPPDSKTVDKTLLDKAGYGNPAADAAYPNNTIIGDLTLTGNRVKWAVARVGWTGPVWNTEFNMTGSTDKNTWGPANMTAVGTERCYRQMLLASIAAGYDKCFIYAADHASLGSYAHVGQIPAGEYADAWFKDLQQAAPNSAVIAAVIDEFIGGETCVFGLTGVNAHPFYCVGTGRLKIASPETDGFFVEQ